MAPKEKAKQLVEKYADSLPSVFYNVVESKNYHRAKQCALIAVDEIIFVLLDTEDTFDKFVYYREVKQEIEKL